MKSIRADFVQRPAPSRRLWIASGLLATGAIAVTLWAATTWQSVERQRGQLRQALAQRETPRLVPAAEPPKPYEAHARDMLAARAIPWPAALTAMENSTVVGVTPTSVEFDTNGTIRLTVAFSDYAVLLEYLNTLSIGEPELRWKLAQTQLQGAAGPGGNSSAILVGSWTTLQRQGVR